MTEQRSDNLPSSISADDIPPDLWQACPRCSHLIYAPELEADLWVCSKCSHHMRLTVWQRLQITVDEDSFE